MKITVRADGFEGWKKRARARAEKMDRGEKIVSEITINFDSPLGMFEVLTTERIRLCEVARTQPFSVTGLAAALNRDTKSVRRDIQKLEHYGVLRIRVAVNPGHGRVKIVEPVAKKFELRASF